MTWPRGSGWRVSPSGTLWRWWDGTGWTEHVALIEDPPPGPPVRFVPRVVWTAPIRIVPTEQLPLEQR